MLNVTGASRRDVYIGVDLDLKFSEMYVKQRGEQRVVGRLQ